MPRQWTSCHSCNHCLTHSLTGFDSLTHWFTRSFTPFLRDFTCWSKTLLTIYSNTHPLVHSLTHLSYFNTFLKAFPISVSNITNLLIQDSPYNLLEHSLTNPLIAYFLFQHTSFRCVLDLDVPFQPYHSHSLNHALTQRFGSSCCTHTVTLLPPYSPLWTDA